MIAIIPARGGSKGLPRKNILELCGKPLIAHTIRCALSSSEITDVIVSTEDQEIAEVSRAWGASVPFLRPDELAGDDARAIDAYLFTIERLNSARLPDENIRDFAVLLPTVPLRTPLDVDSAIRLFKSRNAPSVISYAKESHPITWHRYVNEDLTIDRVFRGEGLKNRQDLRPTYYPNGAVYVFRYDFLKNTQQYQLPGTLAYLMPRDRSVDIDSIEDFRYAEYLMQNTERQT